MAGFCFKERRFLSENGDSKKTALVTTDSRLSWCDLRDRAEYFCNILSPLCEDCETVVFISGHQESDFFASILASLMLGVCFVPVDKNTPEKRIDRMKSLLGKGVWLDVNKKTVTDFGLNYRLTKNQIKYAAYIMFTSGSTGEPKGVLISYSNLNNFCNWLKNFIPGRDENVVHCNTSLLSFDLSMLSWIASFQNGETLVSVDSENLLEMKKLFSFLSNNKVNSLVVTPSLLRILMSTRFFTSDNFSSIKNVYSCGEVLPPLLASKLLNKFPDVDLYNVYGPTECTVVVTGLKIDKNIIDRFGNLLPVGMKCDFMEINDGELEISGPSVMMGYLDDLSNDKEFKMNRYFTGDLAFFDGGYLFVEGRKDDQVKFNGYRISLKDIDAVMQGHGLIEFSKTIALIRSERVVKLVSFVQSTHLENGPVNNAHDIFYHLNSELPVYMVPSDIYSVDSIPVNDRYKVDSSKLLSMLDG